MELLVAEPGPYSPSVTSADGLTSFPSRRIDVPDADTATADFAFGGVPVSGLVVDAETSAPVSGSVFAAPKAGSEGRPANTRTGADGRFQLALDRGDFTLTDIAEG